MNQQEEMRLIRKVVGGDVEAFAPLVERYQRACFLLVLRIVGRREEAEEVTQDVFVKAFRSLARFDGRSRFSTWLYRIACNTALSAVRGGRKRYTLFDAERVERVELTAEEAEGEEAALLNEAQIEELLHALDRLLPDERALIQLHYYEQLPLAECAKALHLTEVNTKVRLHRIRKKLERWINEQK